MRMVTIGPDYSVALCGGTHAGRAGDLGLFRFVGESAIAAGIRRVEGVVGAEAVLFSQEEHRALLSGAALLKTPPEKLAEKISQLQEERKSAERELEKLQSARLGALAAELAAKAKRLGNAVVVVEMVAGVEGKGLRELASQLRGKAGGGEGGVGGVGGCAIFLAGGSSLLALTDKELGGDWDAREWMKAAAAKAGAKGGGRADFAQAGGADVAKLDAALRAAEEWARGRG